MTKIGGYEQLLGEPLITEEVLQARVAEIGIEISRDYANETGLLMICILRGGIMFLTDLMRSVTVPHAIDFMAVSSYGVGARISSGQIQIVM